MQEHSFKNLKGEFAFWDKNPNRSTQSDTLKKTFENVLRHGIRLNFSSDNPAL